MIEKAFKYTRIILSIYFVYFFIDYSISNIEKLKSIILYSSTTLIFITLIKIFNIFTNSIIFKKIVLMLGVEINFAKAQELTVLNNLGNFIGPLKLGSGMRIEYLRQKYKLNVKDFILLNFNFAVYSQIIFLTTFTIAVYMTSRINTQVLIGLLAILVLGLIVLRKESLFNLVNILYSKELMNSVLLNLSIFSLFLLGSLVVFMEVNLILNNSYSFVNSIFIFQGISLTNLVNLTPANLGVRELALTTINSLHELNLNQLIEIGIIDRFCSITATFICFLFQNVIRLRGD